MPKDDLRFIDSTLGVVDSFITEESSPIFKDVFNGSHSQHEYHRQHGDLLPKGVDGRDPVEKDNEEKIEIGEPVELLEEVLGQEAEHGVLCGPDVVVGVAVVGVVRVGH